MTVVGRAPCCVFVAALAACHVVACLNCHPCSVCHVQSGDDVLKIAKDKGFTSIVAKILNYTDAGTLADDEEPVDKRRRAPVAATAREEL